MLTFLLRRVCLALWKGTTPGFRPQCLFTYQNPLSCSLALSHVLKCRHACMYAPVHVGVSFSVHVLSLWTINSYAESRGHCQMPSLITLHLTFLKTESVVELKSWALGSSLGWTSWHLPTSVLQHWGYR